MTYNNCQCHHSVLQQNHKIQITMTNSEVFKLELLESKDYLDYSLNDRNIFSLTHTILIGSAVSLRLKIQKHAYRLMQSLSHSSPSLVLLLKCQTLPSNSILSPYSLIQKHGSQVKFSRPNLQILPPSLFPSLSIPIPNIPQAVQLHIFIHNSSIYQNLLKLLLQQHFLIPTKRQEIFINFIWLKGKKFIANYGNTEMTAWRRLVAQNLNNKQKQNGGIENYFKINVKGFCEENGGEKGDDWGYGYCLFVPNKTKLILQISQHYDLNEVVKILKLGQLEKLVYQEAPYKNLMKQITKQIQYKPEKKMILLKTLESEGISNFMHWIGQNNDYNFIEIDCQYFRSEKELINKIKLSDSYSSTIIFVKNIQWLLETGNDKHDEQEKMKRIIRGLEQGFFTIGDQSLTSHIMIICYKGNSIKLDMTKNAHLINFQLTKQQRIKILSTVVQYYKKQKNLQLQDPQQILNLTSNSLNWPLFSKILSQFVPSPQSSNPITLSTSTLQSTLSKYTNLQKVQNIKSISWSDVGGLSHAKQQILQTILLPTKHPQIFDQWIKPRTGLLFFGPPGTGKTLLGKCIANECKMGFISVKGPELLNMYIGESEKNVRDVFERAKESRPCIVFMDQLDALVPKRGQSSDSNQVMDRIVSQLLTQMDQAPSNGIFVIGATNRPDLLDPSILRPGRFDKQLYLGINKQRQSRIQILKAQTRHIKLREGFDYGKVIDKVPQNFTGADFYGLTSRSIMKAAQRFIQQYQNNQKTKQQQVTITEQDFIEIAKQMKPSVSMKQLQHYQKLKQEYK